jgi:uncharacterized HAD superfamily protein
MIGIDIDGVLADSDPSFRAHLQKIYQRPFLRKDVVYFDYQKCFGLSLVQIEDFWQTFSAQGKWEKIKVIPGALSVLKHFNKKDIILITARPDYLKKETLSWLKMNKIPYSRLLFMAGESKHHDVLAHKLKFDYFIEDRFEYSRDLADLGIKVLLLNYPWNKKFGEYPGITRVNSWKDIGKIILK